MSARSCENVELVKCVILQSLLGHESDDAKIDPRQVPCYADSVYLSEKCRPSAGEHMLLRALDQRPGTTVHDAALTINANQATVAKSMEDFVRVSMLHVIL